jgi:hypothetical protein
MKSLMILLWLLCGTVLANAQEVNEYRETNKTALDIPASQTNSTADIATYIKAHFDTDQKKVRAIYIWVAANIKYDKDSLRRVILNEDREQMIATALRRRKGVCENFAAIFNDICKKSGLRSFVIEGYTRQNGSADKSAHAWCTVFIDNKWFLYDPTWDADLISRNRFTQSLQTNYFQVSPLDFIQSHIAFDPLFQLLNYPLTYKEFNNGNTQMNNRKPYFNYIDSMSVYEKLEPLNKYVTAVYRIERNGTPNSMTATKLSQLKMEIEIIYQDKDSVFYNDAIADYNAAIVLFNTFINYRNAQFTPAKTDIEVQAIFDGIKKHIASARSKLQVVNQSEAILTLNTGDVEKALDNLVTHTKEQQAFLKNYQSTAKEK